MRPHEVRRIFLAITYSIQRIFPLVCGLFSIWSCLARPILDYKFCSRYFPKGSFSLFTEITISFLPDQYRTREAPEYVSRNGLIEASTRLQKGTCRQLNLIAGYYFDIFRWDISFWSVLIRPNCKAVRPHKSRMKYLAITYSVEGYSHYRVGFFRIRSPLAGFIPDCKLCFWYFPKKNFPFFTAMTLLFVTD